jgi:hypothetical protein
MWDERSNILVEIYRRYVAFVYLYETLQRHVTENSHLNEALSITLCLFNIIQIMTRRSCIICLHFTCALSFSCTVTQPFSISYLCDD